MMTMLNAGMTAMLSLALYAHGPTPPLEAAVRAADGTPVAAAPAGQTVSTPPPAPVPATPPVPPTARPRSERSQPPRPRPERRTGRGPWTEVSGEPLVATFTGSDGDVLELSNTSGNITVTGVGGGQGRIVARRTAGGRTDADARALLGRMRLGVSQHAQRVAVRVEPSDDAARFRLDYEITLPKGMGVDITNVSGAVSVARIAGDVRVESLSGNINGEGLTRVRSLRTMSGDIEVAASALVGDTNVQTVSGSVVATSLKATSLTLGSVSGNILLKDVGCERVNIRTVNGDIAFASPALGGGHYELKTHAGTIEVTPGARSAGFQFEAQTFKGTIRAEGTTAGERARQATGRVGDGSAFFDLTSFVGDIRIRKQ